MPLADYFTLHHWWLCLVMVGGMCRANLDLDEYGRTPLSKNITAILDRLVNKTTYDKRLRPNYGGEPVEVGITIYVSSISAVSEVEMDYTVDFYLRQTWEDPRLAFQRMLVPGPGGSSSSTSNGGEQMKLTVGWDYTGHIWLPDTFFPNEKKSTFHTATTHNSFLRISADGHILTSQRLTVTASCAMNLLLFPLDSQVCTLEIESYGYSTADIRLVWLYGAENSTTVDDLAKELPTFALAQYRGTERTQNLSTGTYSRLSCAFHFHRNIGFYWIQIYQPCVMVVIISWVTFWINRDSAPARVTLGIMTVLTMTTLTTTTNRQMPKVGYIKAVDIYLGVSYVMVFAALIEYAAVSYSNKKLQDRKKARQTPAADPPPPPPPEDPVGAGDPRQLSIDRYAPRRTTAMAMAGGGGALFNKFRRRRRKVGHSGDNRLQLVASGVDKYSRILFPTIFALFNIVYWTVYLRLSGKI